MATMAFADFSEHGMRYHIRPTFRASPTRGYASEISPNKGHDLSLPKLPIYLRSFFRFGFAVSSPLAWSRRPRMRFLFVTWQVSARMWSTAVFRSTLTHTFAGFLSTVCRLAAVALASYSLSLEIRLVY